MCACCDAVFILPVSQNTPLTPQLSLQLRGRMFWEALLHYGKKRKRGKQVAKGGPEMRTDLKCQNSLDGRQRRARERNGCQTAFHGLSDRDTLSPDRTVSH